GLWLLGLTSQERQRQAKQGPAAIWTGRSFRCGLRVVAFAQWNLAQEEHRDQTQQHDDETQEEDVVNGRCQAHLYCFKEHMEECQALWATCGKGVLQTCQHAWIQEHLGVLERGRHRLREYRWQVALERALKPV